jgi:hypothetical protein
MLRLQNTYIYVAPWKGFNRPIFANNVNVITIFVTMPASTPAVHTVSVASEE